MAEVQPLSPAARARQRKKVHALAAFLIVSGILLLFVLDRVPLPLRIIAGLGDIVAGAVLLVMARQKFGPLPPPAP